MHNLKNNYDLFVFDLDGTLIDSKKDICLALNQALMEFNLPEKTPDELSDLLAQGSTGLFAHVVPKIPEYKKVLTRFRELYAQNILVHTTLYPGTLEVLEALKDKKMAVLSNKSHGFCEAILRDLNLNHLFCPVFGGDSFETKKPDPQGLLKVCEITNIAPQKTVMIGDSPVDVEAGKAAQAFTVGILQGFTSSDLVKSAKADLNIDSLQFLLSHL